MVEYTKQGQYGAAIQLGQQSIRNEPSNDEFIYEQIANVYVIRAQKDSDRRSAWISQAVANIDKALALHSKVDDPGGVHLFQFARGYEFAGDLSDGQRCTYYESAKRLLEERRAALQGENISVAGRTLPLAALRAENEKVVAEVTAKAAKAGCP